MSFLKSEAPLLVYLAGGVQGGAVVQAALKRGLSVRALVRNPALTPGLSRPDVERVRADLSDPVSLLEASKGARFAVIQIPTGPLDVMKAQAANALNAARACDIEGLILRLASASRPAPCEEPSFVANRMIEGLASASGLPFAVVRPTLYLENLLKPSALADILDAGVFSPPIAATQAIAWTSVQDCANAALTLLENGAFGGDHRIAGPESLAGPVFAARLSRAMGRSIRYQAQPIDSFEREIDDAMGPGVGRKISSKFRYFSAYPEEARTILADPYAPDPALSGFEPMTIEDWANANRAAFSPAQTLPDATAADDERGNKGDDPWG